MTFSEIKSILNSNHFTVRSEETVFSKSKKVTGLIIDEPNTIRMDIKVERIKKVLEENNIKGYKVYGLKNKGEIYIEPA